MGTRNSSDQNDVNLLISKLEAATELKKRGKASKRIYKIMNSDKELISWKFNEWDYAKDKIELPSNARGLFTLVDEPRIAVRGYDKFFNINEVPFTRWEWLESNTKGPYQVTAKENGCIILISGLEDGTIVVCSKHSTGDRQDATKNHAIAGQKVLEHQLKLKGLSTKDLALKLYQLNVTAVAEFCDDDFEEHIIQYKNEDAGLYLHGINLNKPLFETYPIEAVSEFASTYGFKTVENFTIDEISCLKKKLSEYSLSGSYNDKEIEGFVIRCKRIKNSKEEDYFFKFKFEEPYLMYRQWREVTKEYLSHRDRLSIKFSKHRFVTNKYLDFVIPLLEKDPKLAADYNSGFKIIELRNKFLESYGKTGSEILNQELLEELEVVNSMKELKIDESTKFVIIPVATIGCGKTTTAQTLVNLYNDWSLVSNDDIPNGKAAKHLFVKRSLECLKKSKVVIMDRNNHQYREREQIFKDFAEFRDDYIAHDTNVQFICLNFVPDDSDTEKIWKNTLSRVISRGDNHQSIKAESESAKVQGIMSGFVKRFQYVNQEKEPDSIFNFVIELDSTGEMSSLENTDKILKELHSKYPVLVDIIPESGVLENAFSCALKYKPEYHKSMGKATERGIEKKKKANSENPESLKARNCTKRIKTKSPVYFSISIPKTGTISSKVQELLSHKGSLVDIDSSFNEFLNSKLMSEFHVTLAHCIQGKKGNEYEKFVWSKYMNVLENRKTKENNHLGYSADLKLKSLLWNEEIATVLVEISKIYRDESNNELSVKSANNFPHITYALLSNTVKPFQSNVLAKEASKCEGEGVFDNGLRILHFNDESTVKRLPVIVNY